MRDIRLYLLLLILVFIFPCTAFSQMVPAVNGIEVPLTLTFSTSVANPTAVVFHPTFQYYYIIRAGNSAFPLETLSSTGTPLFQTTAGLDTRGMWWNPLTQQVERNLYFNAGWATVDLNGSGYAQSTYTSIFSGQLQPNMQSVGAFDYKTNRVLYYDGGSLLHFYDRNSGTSLGTLTLTGSSFANLNTNTVIYTGQTGYEVGLLEHVQKKIMLYNINTGAFSGSVPLPSSAPAMNAFRFSYANDLVWLMDSPNATWHGYYIWDVVLPIENFHFEAILQGENALLSWEMESFHDNILDYTVERGEGSGSYIPVYQTKDISTSAYTFRDESLLPGRNDYRIKVHYMNGQEAYSDVKTLWASTLAETVQVYPNPVKSVLTLRFSPSPEASVKYILLNEIGQEVMEIYQESSIQYTQKEISVAHLSSGIYFLKSGNKSIKIIKE